MKKVVYALALVMGVFFIFNLQSCEPCPECLQCLPIDLREYPIYDIEKERTANNDRLILNISKAGIQLDNRRITSDEYASKAREHLSIFKRQESDLDESLNKIYAAAGRINPKVPRPLPPCGNGKCNSEWLKDGTPIWLSSEDIKIRILQGEEEVGNLSSNFENFPQGVTRKLDVLDNFNPNDGFTIEFSNGVNSLRHEVQIN